MHSQYKSKLKTFLSILVLCAPVSWLYGQFLWNRVVFDDSGFFNIAIHEQYLHQLYKLELRWLPYATLEWTRVLLGTDLIWYRLGNLALHLATTAVLFLFLRRLFTLVLPNYQKERNRLSLHWLAFFGALIFALHPAAVYAVGYLIQRSILMATLFSLLTWLFFLEGLVREKKMLLFCSIITYVLAVFSKEHALMAPAITVTSLFLIKGLPTRSWFHINNTLNQELTHKWVKLIWPTFVLYGLVGAFVIYQMKSNHILGQAYEPFAGEMFSRLGSDFDSRLAYPLSFLNQTSLYFKYLWLWAVPNPSAMSVDMYQNFPIHFISWPHTLGLLFFIIYPLIAFLLLCKRGLNGLLGFALLCPWLLFATELASVRIQESFVLYRSYLWMAGLFAATPFICQKLSPKMAFTLLLILSIFMMPLSWIKLSTFSNRLALWDDAVTLAERNGQEYPGMERMYYNRGNAFYKMKDYKRAMSDYNNSIRLGGEHNRLNSTAYNNRGVIYFENKQYQEALSNFKKAIEADPRNKDAALSMNQTLEVMNEK